MSVRGPLHEKSRVDAWGGREKAAGLQMATRITVSIPTVRPKTLRCAIDSIRRQSYTDWELIVVGQGPDDELRRVTEECAALDARIRYLHLNQLGISHARNAAVAEAQGEILAFTDDDCEADPGWLSEIAQCFDEDSQLGLVGGSLLAPNVHQHLLAVCPEIRPSEVTYDPVRDGHKAPPGFDFTGANFAMRRSVALRVGPFDECMGVGAIFASAEDLDYKLRVESADIRMRSTPKLVVRHTHGCRIGFKAVFRHRRSYAVGQGALAAKMTMRGDPRGRQWLGFCSVACDGDSYSQGDFPCLNGCSYPKHMPLQSF